MEHSRFVEAVTGYLARELAEFSNTTAAPEASRARLVSLLDAIFEEDREFLARVKLLLRHGLVLFETHQKNLLEQAGENLVKLLAGIPDAVEEYYSAVARHCREHGWIPSDLPEVGDRETKRDSLVLKTIISTDYWLMEENTPRRVTFIKRHAVPVRSIEELVRQNSQLISLMRPEEERFGVVVDMRQAPSRNDPEFEDAMSQFRSEIYRHYARVAVLVTSAVGVLQVNRMARDEHADTFATQSEAAAVRFAAGE